MSESRQYESGALTTEQVREIRRRLLDGRITPEEARRMGFPPAEPIKESR
jgi:hypothetical protein